MMDIYEKNGRERQLEAELSCRLQLRVDMIGVLMSKTENKELREIEGEAMLQLGGVIEELNFAIRKAGAAAAKPSPWKRALCGWAVRINILFDRSESHIARLLASALRDEAEELENLSEDDKEGVCRAHLYYREAACIMQSYRDRILYFLN